MRAAAHEGGTCSRFQNLGMDIGAKSGTAETSGGKEDHSWVVGYYPVSNPKYGFVGFVQNGGHGADAALPVIYDVLKFMKKHEIIRHRTPADEANALTGR
jgi:penicillin-binding protein 2